MALRSALCRIAFFGALVATALAAQMPFECNSGMVPVYTDSVPIANPEGTPEGISGWLIKQVGLARSSCFNTVRAWCLSRCKCCQGCTPSCTSKPNSEVIPTHSSAAVKIQSELARSELLLVVPECSNEMYALHNKEPLGSDCKPIDRSSDSSPFDDQAEGPC